MDKQLVTNLSIALNYIENAYEHLNYYVKNEDQLSDNERDKFYKYGREKLILNVCRLANTKKAINSVLENRRMRDVITQDENLSNQHGEIQC